MSRSSSWPFKYLRDNNRCQDQVRDKYLRDNNRCHEQVCDKYLRDNKRCYDQVRDKFVTNNFVTNLPWFSGRSTRYWGTKQRIHLHTRFSKNGRVTIFIFEIFVTNLKEIFVTNLKQRIHLHTRFSKNGRVKSCVPQSYRFLVPVESEIFEVSVAVRIRCIPLRMCIIDRYICIHIYIYIHIYIIYIDIYQMYST